MALFSKQSIGGGAIGYEVVIIQQAAEGTMFDTVVPAHEHMPSSESWGRLGWTYPDLSLARAKFYSLTAKQPHNSDSMVDVSTAGASLPFQGKKSL